MVSYVVGALAVVLALTSAVGLVRRAVWRPAPVHGDPSLVDMVSAAQPRGARRLAVVVVDRSGTRSAFVRADPLTRFEIGSVSKALTGLLLAAEIAAGRCRLDDRLDELDDRYAGSPVGAVTLRSLCTHHSGLPRLPATWRTSVRGIATGLLGVDPYRGVGDDRVTRDASRARLGRAGYTNLGAAVLGNALARRSGTTFAALLRERVLDPLGMNDTGVATEQRFRAARGTSSSGRRAAPWVMSGYAPAGGITSTPHDLALLVEALALRTAPGMAALQPLDELSGGLIGMFWLVSGRAGGGRVWHNGSTGGYAAYLAVDEGRGVVAVADVADATAVERLAVSALG